MPLPSSQPLSREYRIYLALWRKAVREKDLGLEPVSIKVSSPSVALSIRSGLYKAIKPYRNGQAVDEELTRAAEQFVVSTPKDEAVVKLLPRASLIELEAELAALGIDEADLALPEEVSMNAALEELITPSPVSQARATPFYSREG